MVSNYGRLLSIVVVLVCCFSVTHTEAQTDSDPVAIINADLDLSKRLYAPQTVNFDFTSSTGSEGSRIIRYRFDPGDGDYRENFGSVSIPYANDGKYEVKLQVEDEHGKVTYAYKRLELIRQSGKELPDYATKAPDEFSRRGFRDKNPEAVLTANVTKGPAPLKVTYSFKGSYSHSGYSLKYFFLDGQSQPKSGKKHGDESYDRFKEVTYSKPGKYIAKLTVVEDRPAGASEGNEEKFDHSTFLIEVTDPADGSEATNDVPIAVIGASTTKGVAPLEVDFSFLDSHTRDGSSVAEYYFDWGNGELIPAGPAASHTYSHEGKFVARVQVWNKHRRHHTATVVIDVERRPVGMPPVAKIKAAPTRGPAPLEVTFDFTESDYVFPATALSYEFSNGISNFVPSPPAAGITFNDPGEYNCMLRVTDDRGQFAFASVLIVVEEPERRNDAGHDLDGMFGAVLGASTLAGEAPLTVDFDFSASTGNIIGNEFHDGLTSVVYDVESTSTTYTEPGTYEPYLRVWSPEGYDAQAVTITVYPPREQPRDDALDDPMGMGDRYSDPELDPEELDPAFWDEGFGEFSSDDDPLPADAGDIDPGEIGLTDGVETVKNSKPVPVLDYRVDPDMEGGYEVNLNVNRSYSPAGLLISRYWVDIGDGKGWKDISLSQSYKTATNNAGEYMVGVKVEDENGGIASQFFPVTIEPEDNQYDKQVAPVPVVTASVTDDAGQYYLDLTFAESYSPAGHEITRYTYWFDDGGGWRNPHDPALEYLPISMSGRYTVGLQVEDSNGGFAEKWFNFDVELPGVPWIGDGDPPSGDDGWDDGGGSGDGGSGGSGGGDASASLFVDHGWMADLFYEDSDPVDVKFTIINPSGLSVSKLELDYGEGYQSLDTSTREVTLNVATVKQHMIRLRVTLSDGTVLTDESDHRT